MRQPGSLRPTPDGIGLAKDVWLLGAGLTLLLDRRPVRRSRSDGPSATTRPGSDDDRRSRVKPIAVAAVTSEEKPYGVRIDSGGHALRGDEPVSHGGGDSRSGAHLS